MTTMIFLALLASVVLGPKKAIQLSSKVGAMMRELNKTKADLMGQLQGEIAGLEASVNLPSLAGVPESQQRIAGPERLAEIERPMKKDAA